MSVILHISDTHFGTEVAAALAALLALHAELQPDLVVLSGDVTQRARLRQFESAARFFAALGPRAQLVLPGNHDIPLWSAVARVFFPYAGYARVFGQDLEPVFESDDLLVVGVNTTRPWRWKDGEISSSQIDRVAQRLAATDALKLKVIVTHQPVHVVTSKDVKNLVRQGEPAVRRWTEHGADLFLGGHIHLPYVRPLEEPHPGPPRRSWIAQAGTALSSRVRGGIPNAVNVIRYDQTQTPRHCRVERWDFCPPSFVLYEERVLELS